MLNRAGDRARALHEYQSFEGRLASAYGATPAPETIRLAQQIRASGEHESVSVAVLPFSNDTGDPGNDYLVNGIGERLITDLARQPNLLVTAQASALKFASIGGTTATVTRDLGVRYALQGSVRLAGCVIEVPVRLMDARTMSERWADTLRAPADGVLALQQRLTTLVTQALHGMPSQDASPGDTGTPDRGLTDPRAYEAYLRARHAMWRQSAEEGDRVILLLNRALELVGDSALLHATLGSVYFFLVYSGARSDDWYITTAEACASRALQLDDHCAPAHVLRAQLQRIRGKPLQGVPALRKALDRSAQDPDALFWLAYTYSMAGRPGAARPLMSTLLSIDPLGAQNHALAGWVELSDGKFKAAIPGYRRGAEMEGSVPSKLCLGITLARAGQIEEADRVLTEVLSSRNTHIAHLQLADFHQRALRGDRDAALGADTPEIVAVARRVEYPSWVIAGTYALVGRVEDALEWLENTVRLGLINYPLLARLDPHLENLRKEPRFVELMERVRCQWEAFEA